MCEKFMEFIAQSMTVHGFWGYLCWKLLDKLYCDVYEAGNDREIRVHKVNRRLVIFLGIVTEGFTILENSVHKNNFCEIMCLVE